jgi:hypothetical protein
MFLEDSLTREDITPEDIDYWEYTYGYNEYEVYYKVIDQKIKTDPSFAFKYAEKNGRLSEECEKIFLKSAKFAFLYSFWVIKGRLPPKIEKVFEKTPSEAYLYACHIYKRKLPKNLENSFRFCPKHAYFYATFLKQRLDHKIEEAFIKDTKEERDPLYDDFHFTYLYSKEIIKGKFPKNIHRSLLLRYTFDENCSKKLLKEYFEENK